MVRCILIAVVCAIVFMLFGTGNSVRAQQAFGANWGQQNTAGNMERFYHYPYVYYPQNYWGGDYYRSADSMYYRYPPEMRIPVYNRHWHNYYPSHRRYHWGHHFITDIF
jgi:hypothetical protein